LAPTRWRRGALAPLAGADRQLLCGYDARLLGFKVRALIRAERKLAATGGGPLLAPFLGSGGGWGAKGPHGLVFLHSDPVGPLRKRRYVSAARAALALWAKAAGNSAAPSKRAVDLARPANTEAEPAQRSWLAAAVCGALGL
jgi:hypothetical protein